MTVITCPRCTGGTINGPNGTRLRCAWCNGTTRIQQPDLIHDPTPGVYLLRATRDLPDVQVPAGTRIAVKETRTVTPDEIAVARNGIDYQLVPGGRTDLPVVGVVVGFLAEEAPDGS